MNQPLPAIENIPSPQPEIPRSFRFFYVLVIGLIILVAPIVIGAYWLGKQATTPQPVACTMDAKECPDGSYVSRIPPFCEFAKCPINQVLLTQTIDETANWKTYTNQDSSYSFKYPVDWVLTEKIDGVRDGVWTEIEPDIRIVVGACPGYSFWAGEPDPNANYSIYTPLQQKTISNRNINYYSKTDTYSCTSNIAFFSKSLVVELISKKTSNQQLFDQILSTFKFTN